MKTKHILQGKFLAHPLHPALVHLPIGFWVASFIFDLVSQFQANVVLGNFIAVGYIATAASWYCILFGIIAALPTAVTGLAEFLDVPRSSRAQTIAMRHMGLNVAILIGYVAQLAVRDRAASFVSGGLLAFNLVELVFLGISGSLGARLVFEYRIGSRRPMGLHGEPLRTTEDDKTRKVA